MPGWLKIHKDNEKITFKHASPTLPLLISSPGTRFLEGKWNENKEIQHLR